MSLENPALNKRSFLRGTEEAGAEARTMTASGTYAITGLLLVIAGSNVLEEGRKQPRRGIRIAVR